VFHLLFNLDEVTCYAGFDIDIAQMNLRNISILQCSAGEVCAEVHATLTVSFGFVMHLQGWFESKTNFCEIV